MRVENIGVISLSVSYFFLSFNLKRMICSNHEENIAHRYYILLASERDTIRGVQIRADAVRIYIYIYVWNIYIYMYGSTCAILVAHATYM